MDHKDCKYFLAADVFKGICKRTKDPVNADEASCESFEKSPRCRYCCNYKEQEEFLGLCKGKSVAYPDMNASTCKDFTWN